MASVHEQLEIAREKLARGDYAGALTHADAALTQDGASLEALQLRSRALYLLGRDQEALQALRQAHHLLHRALPTAHWEEEEDDPFTEPPLTEHVGIGVDALEIMLALRERHPFDGELLALLAELAEDAGRNEIAREAYEELVAKEPNRLEAWEGLVHILTHEDMDAAFGALERALQVFPRHTLFFEFLGYIRYRRRQFRQAIIAYRQAIEHGAGTLENHQALAQCYLALDDHAAALELIRVAVAQNPNDTDAHRMALEMAVQCGEPALALQEAHQLMRLEPAHAESYCLKAWTELSAQDWPAAERTLRLGFHKAVDGAYALFELVDVLIGTNQLDLALRVADLAGELAPQHPESLAARGKVLREMGAFTEALTAFRQAALLAPQDDAYQTWIGVVLDNQGEYLDAIRQFTQVLARHPSDVWTLTNRGLAHLAMDQYEQALADFTCGIELDPHDAPLYFWRACTRVHQGDLPTALGDLRRALDLSDEIHAWLEQEPSLEPLREHPHFRALLQRAEGE